MSEKTTPRKQPSALWTLFCIVAIVAMCAIPFFIPDSPTAEYRGTVSSKTTEQTHTLVPVGMNGEMVTQTTEEHFVTVQLHDGSVYSVRNVSARTFNALKTGDAVIVTAEFRNGRTTRIKSVRKEGDAR